MTITKTVFIGIAFCLILGIAAAGLGGWHIGTTYLLNSWVQEQAGDVKGHLETLQKLRAGNTVEAIEFLETLLDDDLIVLEPEGCKLKEHINAQMHMALRAAKQYRTDYPRKCRRSSIDEMVQNVLSRDIPNATDKLK
jgi:hypothetical protein